MVDVIVYKPSPYGLVFIHDKSLGLRPQVYHLSHQTCAGLCVLYSTRDITAAQMLISKNLYAHFFFQPIWCAKYDIMLKAWAIYSSWNLNMFFIVTFDSHSRLLKLEILWEREHTIGIPIYFSEEREYL